MSSRAASVFRASLSPPGSDCSYSRPVAWSQPDSACRYSALKRQMQLSRPGTHGSRASPGWPSSACLTCAPRSISPQRRRSKAISTSVSATGLLTTASRKFCLYWIQSQTTRSLARSAGEAQTASMIGPSTDRAAADSRSFLVGRRSTSIAIHPDAGTVEDAGDRLLVPGRQQVHPGHAVDRGKLLDGLGREPRPLGGGLVRRDPAQPAVHVVRHLHPWHLVPHEVQRPPGPDRADAGQDVTPLVQPEVTDLHHPPAERTGVEDELGLHELRAGRDLLAEPFGSEPGRRRERVLHRAQERSEERRVGKECRSR